MPRQDDLGQVPWLLTITGEAKTVADRPTGGAPAAGTAGAPDPERPTRPQDDRRARIEELKRRKKRSERMRTMAFLLVALIALAAIFGKHAYNWLEGKINDPLKRDISSFGVPLADAGCGKATDDAASGNQKHIAVGIRVNYDKVPPSSGEHYSNPVLFSATPFFTEKDRPPVENLVHNMEHGYTILWYDPTLPKADQDEIKGLALRLRTESKYQQFIAVAWDDTYGKFPKKKFVALSHWSGNGEGVKNDQSKGHRMLCEQASGEAVQKFMDDYPATDAPERNIR
jgi:hypothetical protein